MLLLVPDIAVGDIEHHHRDVLVLVVILLALVPELRLDFDQTVEGLVGDEGLVPGVQLHQEGGLAPVDDGLVLAGPGAGVGQVHELTPVELQCLGAFKLSTSQHQSTAAAADCTSDDVSGVL